MPDLAVYNLTSLTGLLGPVKHVTAMLSIVTPERDDHRQGPDQGDRGRQRDGACSTTATGVISHVQSGFNYFNPHGHDGSKETRHTISIVGSAGFMGLVGYDWAPLGVDLATQRIRAKLERHVTDAQGYIWQQGAALAAECLVTGQGIARHAGAGAARAGNHHRRARIVGHRQTHRAQLHLQVADRHLVNYLGKPGNPARMRSEKSGAP